MTQQKPNGELVLDKTTGLSAFWTSKDKSLLKANGDYKHQRPCKAVWITNDIMSNVQDKIGITADTINPNIVVIKAINGFYGLTEDLNSVNRSPDARVQAQEKVPNAKADKTADLKALKEFCVNNKILGKHPDALETLFNYKEFPKEKFDYNMDLYKKFLYNQPKAKPKSELSNLGIDIV